ncbi:N-terminal nucleophile aminohydrolases (Ntnhydrolases) superfamily protein [Striga asiatica]|uniref:N-terminal nucleophile aminohydrolases (Ntnhydrolases) superfamily protein n=1 Tax=Striga asiatica TaxID=4170 RepID=A0A5A7QPM3_STRAF|nr:N-terminal nucleophile aminohydrolases (Ntnhydrolases) superfamily protein [Striga asiatica]
MSKPKCAGLLEKRDECSGDVRRHDLFHGSDEPPPNKDSRDGCRPSDEPAQGGRQAVAFDFVDGGADAEAAEEPLDGEAHAARARAQYHHRTRRCHPLDALKRPSVAGCRSHFPAAGKSGKNLSPPPEKIQIQPEEHNPAAPPSAPDKLPALPFACTVAQDMAARVAAKAARVAEMTVVEVLPRQTPSSAVGCTSVLPITPSEARDERTKESIWAEEVEAASLAATAAAADLGSLGFAGKGEFGVYGAAEDDCSVGPGGGIVSSCCGAALLLLLPTSCLYIVSASSDRVWAA